MVFWNLVRNRRLGGLKFRRQQPLGPFIADFYCADAKLVVEIDGVIHETCAERDAERDTWLREEGIDVLRIRPVDLRDKQRDVMEWVYRTAMGRMESPFGRG